MLKSKTSKKVKEGHMNYESTIFFLEKWIKEPSRKVHIELAEARGIT